MGYLRNVRFLFSFFLFIGMLISVQREATNIINHDRVVLSIRITSNFQSIIR